MAGISCRNKTPCNRPRWHILVRRNIRSSSAPSNPRLFISSASSSLGLLMRSSCGELSRHPAVGLRSLDALSTSQSDILASKSLRSCSSWLSSEDSLLPGIVKSSSLSAPSSSRTSVGSCIAEGNFLVALRPSVLCSSSAGYKDHILSSHTQARAWHWHSVKSLFASYRFAFSLTLHRRKQKQTHLFHQPLIAV
jgi:hypothetical protein